MVFYANKILWKFMSNLERKHDPSIRYIPILGSPFSTSEFHFPETRSLCVDQAVLKLILRSTCLLRACTAMPSDLFIVKSVLFACMYFLVPAVRRGECGFPDTAVTHGFKSLCGCLEVNPILLQEQ